MSYLSSLGTDYFDKLIMNRLFTVIAIVVVIAGSGCALEEKQRTIQQPEAHLHKYHFTEVMGDYHVRLEVDHGKGKMFIIFEDISERPVKLLSLKTIGSKVIFPDGTIKTVTFRSLRPIYRKLISLRKSGIYVVRKEWLETTPSFVVKVKIRFKGRKYELTFNYEVPSGKIPA